MSGNTSAWVVGAQYFLDYCSVAKSKQCSKWLEDWLNFSPIHIQVKILVVNRFVGHSYEWLDGWWVGWANCWLDILMTRQIKSWKFFLSTLKILELGFGGKNALI